MFFLGDGERNELGDAHWSPPRRIAADPEMAGYIKLEVLMMKLWQWTILKDTNRILFQVVYLTGGDGPRAAGKVARVGDRGRAREQGVARTRGESRGFPSDFSIFSPFVPAAAGSGAAAAAAGIACPP